jgi:hypothetical protein
MELEEDHIPCFQAQYQVGNLEIIGRKLLAYGSITPL